MESHSTPPTVRVRLARNARANLALAALALCACGRSASAARDPGGLSPPAPAADDAGVGAPPAPIPPPVPSGEAPCELPSSFTFSAELPGPATGRFLNVNVDVADDALRGSGCVEGVRDSCEESSLVMLGAAERADLAAAWCEAILAPRCALTALRDGRGFFIRWPAGDMAGELPGDGTPIETLYGRQCSTEHRLMLWLISKFEP